jgi:hypothetical protein
MYCPRCGNLIHAVEVQTTDWEKTFIPKAPAPAPIPRTLVERVTALELQVTTLNQQIVLLHNLLSTRV